MLLALNLENRVRFLDGAPIVIIMKKKLRKELEKITARKSIEDILNDTNTDDTVESLIGDDIGLAYELGIQSGKKLLAEYLLFKYSKTSD